MSHKSMTKLATITFVEYMLFAVHAEPEIRRESDEAFLAGDSALRSRGAIRWDHIGCACKGVA